MTQLTSACIKLILFAFSSTELLQYLILYIYTLHFTLYTLYFIIYTLYFILYTLYLNCCLLFNHQISIFYIFFYISIFFIQFKLMSSKY